MHKRIIWVSPFRAAFIVAIISFVLVYPIIGIMWMFGQFATKPGSVDLNIWLISPLLISFCVCVLAALGALSYNVIAKLGLCITVRAEPNE